MAKVDEDNILFEIEQELRNADILSTSERNVTTETNTQTGANTASILIPRDNVKNVRDVVIGGTTAAFGTDYTVDLDFDDSGTKRCKISFVVNQTGQIDTILDYGTDRIFSDFPKPTLSLSSFPRIGFDLLDGTPREIELGAASNETEYLLQINVYAKTRNKLIAMKKAVKEFIMNNKKNFFYFPFITPIGYGPTIPPPFDDTKKILQRNIDCRIRFVFEN